VDLRQLQYFVRIVELKSFTRAAEQLRVAQPALGLQIRKLEEELQVQLLLRHSRGVEPTEAGLLLLSHARGLLDAADHAKRTLLAHKGMPRGRVVLGMPASINFEFSAKLVRQCMAELPNISLNIIEELSAVLTEWIEDGRLDLACTASPHTAGMITEPLLEQDLYFVGAPEAMAAEGGPISFADVANHPLVLPGLPNGLRRRVDKVAEDQGLSLHCVHEVQGEPLVCELVRQCVGYTVLPYSSVRRDVGQGSLVARRIVEPVISAQVYLVYRERHPLSEAGRSVRDLIKRLVQEDALHSDGSWRLIEERQA
jgi:LysR family nitrogen assimilation transcriptional regulator